MSNVFKTTIAAALATAVLATTFVPTAEAGRKERLLLGGFAAAIVGTAIIANERKRNRRHHSSRHDAYDGDCYIKRRKVWSDYHGRRVWRDVEVCY